MVLLVMEFRLADHSNTQPNMGISTMIMDSDDITQCGGTYTVR
jgi:hypothetical protein